VRKPTGDTFEFKGQISIGQSVTEVTSTTIPTSVKRNSATTRPPTTGIAAAPKDFSEVSPESIGVRVKLEAAPDFLKGLKGQDVEVSLNSLLVSCDALAARASKRSTSASIRIAPPG